MTQPSERPQALEASTSALDEYCAVSGRNPIVVFDPLSFAELMRSTGDDAGDEAERGAVAANDAD